MKFWLRFWPILLFGRLLVCGYGNSHTLYVDDSCLDHKTNEAGVCVAITNCPSAESDLRSKQKPTICSFQKASIIVCCRNPTTAGNKNTPNLPLWGLEETSQSKPSSDTAGGVIPLNNEPHSVVTKPNQRISVAQCEDFYPIPTTTTLAPGTFGIAAVGGEDSELDEFPHMAALGWRMNNGSLSFKCGGTLISDRYVLTAGHCLYVSRDTTLQTPEPSVIRLGVVNFEGDTNERQPIDIPIAKIIRHPQYKPPSKYYDIALLKLSRPAPRSDRVKPACLWNKESFDFHTTAIVTGWGTTVNRGTTNSQNLQKVDVDILDTKICQPLLDPIHSRHWAGFRDHQLCAGVLQGGKDACQGDSGGPLQVIQSDWPRKYYAVIGVTSFGDQCAQPNKPGVYTRVSSFIDWIESVVWLDTL